VDQDATAFGDRSATHSLIITGEWVDQAESTKNIQWVRDCWEAVRPYAKETVYVNYVDAGEDARFKAAYGANYERLAALKAKYDPDNVFRHNMNVQPATTAS
jgi:FAD/FMN-containing dehydrogenase